MRLFGTSGTDTPAPASGAPAINMISEGTLVEGTVRADGDVRVSGKISGKLLAKGKVILTREAIIHGDLHAGSADIAGTVDGDVTVEEKLILKGTGRVDGHMVCGRLVIEEGAAFNGTVQMGERSFMSSDSIDPVPYDRGGDRP